jgi:hypothetical protein
MINNSPCHKGIVLYHYVGRDLIKFLTTPEAPAVIAIGAVTELNPDEHMTGILTARDIE